MGSCLLMQDVKIAAVSGTHFDEYWRSGQVTGGLPGR
jgi:hypothetical protein